MTEEVKKIINEFESENRKLWGDKFFIINTGNKVVLMTDGLVKSLVSQVGRPGSLIVTSLDCDESVGEWYRVKPGKTGQIYHYYRSNKETERLMRDLPRDDMMTMEQEGSRFATKNELMGGELFRGVVVGDWIAAAVYHDYVDIAPKVIGWIRLNDDIEKLRDKTYFRPPKTISLNKAISTLANLPYHLGGKSLTTGFDCSSMVQWIILHTRQLWLPKLAKWQILVGKKVNENERQRGDLVFFEKAPDWSIEHVGILISKNVMSHAYSDNLRITAESPKNIVVNRKGSTKLSGFYRLHQ